MLINYTENSSKVWTEKQKEEAEKEYLEIVDMPFPEIKEDWNRDKIYSEASQELKKIIERIGEDKLDNKETAVLCQGERNFSFLMTNFLISNGIKVVNLVLKKDGTFHCFRQYDTRKFPKDNTELLPAIYDRDRNCKNNKDYKNDKVLIAQLGKGGYQTTTYVDESGRELSTTGYGFDAIIRKENPNKLLLTGTTESGWIGIVDWYGKLKNLTKEQEKKKEVLLNSLKEDAAKRRENKKKDPERRVEVLGAKSPIWRDIESYIMDIAKFERVKIAIIPKGQNDEELVEYFDILREALQGITEKGKETEVIFDISNGFRSMPLYIMMIVKFMGLINSETIKYIAYYGMFEAKDEQNRTPLVNLTKVTEMTEWINAISEFRNFGSVKALYRCLSMEKEGKSEVEKEEIQQMIRKFEEFESAMNMNNLHYLKESIKYIKDLNSDSIHSMPLPRQAKVMLEDLGKDFERRFIDTKYELNEKYEYTYILMKLSELYMEQGRYNMAAIASQEGIITYILEKYLKEELKRSLFLNDEEVKEYIQNFNNREQVKSHFDAYLNKYKDILDEKYAFGGYYKKIKNKIRNVGAHILPNEKMPNLKEMEEWIYVSINSILKDMEEKILLEHDTETVDLNFGEIYKDYCKTNKKIKEEREKILKKLLFGEEKDKEWEFLDVNHEDIESKYSEVCQEYELDIQKLKEFHKTILFVREKNQNGEEITEKEIEGDLFLKWMLELREKEGEKARENLLKSIEKEQVTGFQTFQNLVRKQWKKEIINKLKRN